MSEVKHTAGPWYAFETSAHVKICTDTDHAIASVGFLQRGVSEQMRANARLIAAAPELLAALKTMLREYADKNATDSQLLQALGGIGFHAVLSARAAIAKATGEA